MDKREQVDAVCKMQSFIEENLDQVISMQDLARISGYSPWYSAKMFKSYTGKTPFEYIRMLRMTEAAKRLKDGRQKIIDVAFDFYFDSHEGFTRAFSKQFGISPLKYSKEKPPVKYFMPYLVSGVYQLAEKGAFTMSENQNIQTVFTQVIEKPSRKMILKRGKEAAEYFAYCEEVGCEVWGVLCSVNEAISEPMGLWLPKKLQPAGTSKYVQGVEVPADYDGAVPEGYELIELEPCKMMIFQGPAYDDEVFMEAISVLEKAIEDYNPELYGFEWADDEAPRFQYEPQGARGYIEGRPVKLLTRSE